MQAVHAQATRHRQRRLAHRALELLRLGYSLMEQNLRREDPKASEDHIASRLAAWKSDADWGEEAPGYLERSADRLARLRRAAD